MSEKTEKNTPQFDPPVSPPPHDGETRPLPTGWIKQFDTNSGAYFYVDTRAKPPRSIWVHPFDDPAFLKKNPEYQNYDHDHDDQFDENPPQYMRNASPAPPIPSSSRPSINDKGKMPEKRSFFGKLKDKAIGTKEERAASKAEAQRAREADASRQRRLEYQRALAAQYGAPPQMDFSQQQGYGYAPGPSTRYVYPQQQQPPFRRQGGFGGGGAALPLLGGLAGGLLLGDIIGGDGFGGDGGGFGGDFGGDGGFF